MGLWNSITSMFSSSSQSKKTTAKKAHGTKSAAKTKTAQKAQPQKAAAKKTNSVFGAGSSKKKGVGVGISVEHCPAESTRIAPKPHAKLPTLPPELNLFAKILPSAAELLNLKKPNLKQNPKAQITHKGKKVTIVEVHNESRDAKGKKVGGYVVAQDASGTKVKIPAHSSLSDPKIQGVKDDSGKVMYIASYNSPEDAHILDEQEVKKHRKREARAISNLVEKDGKRYILKGDKAKQAVSHIHDPELMKEVNNEIALKQNQIDPSVKPKKGFTHLEEAIHQGNYNTFVDDHEISGELIKTLRDNGAYGSKYQLDENGSPKIDPKTGKRIENPEYSQAMGRNAARILDESASVKNGTNEAGINAGLSLIDSEDAMKHVNAYLVEQGYKWSSFGSDPKIYTASPLENLLLSEQDHGTVQEQVKTLFDQGAYGEPYLYDSNGDVKLDTNGRPVENKYYTDCMARNSFREIEHELNGRTSVDGLKSAMDIVRNSPAARLTVENMIHLKHPNLQPDEGSYTRALIIQDGFRGQDVDRFDAVWVANKSYAPAIMDASGAIVDLGDQDHRDKVIDNLCFNENNPESTYKGEFKEFFRVGLDAIDAPPENSADFLHFMDRCKERIDKNPDAYPAEFKGQDYAQQYMRRWFDAEGMNANNTLLYKGAIPPRVQAEASLRLMRDGDFSHSFDSFDQSTYGIMDYMLKNGEVSGVQDLKACYDKAIAGAGTNEYEKAKIQGNAIISGQIEFSDAQVTDICFRLMELSGSAKGKSVSSIYVGNWQNDSEYFDYQISNILESRPDVIDAVECRLDRRRAERARNPLLADGTQDVFSQRFYALINEARDNAAIVGKEQVFLDATGKPITDPKRIQEILLENNAALMAARQQMLLLEREYKKYVDSEGWMGDSANWLSRSLLNGTDRGDVELVYRKSRAFLRRLEAAAQGRLRDSSGNVISMNQLIESEMSQISMQQGTVNERYKISQKVGKGAIYAAPAVIVSMVGTGGGSSVPLTALLACAEVGGAEYILGRADIATSETGNTKERRMELLTSSLRDGVIAGVTFGASQYVENLAFVREYESAAAELAQLERGLQVDKTSRYLELQNFIAENKTVYEEAKSLANRAYVEFSKRYPSLAKAAEKALDKVQDQGFDGLIPDDAKERLIRDSGYLSRVKRA